MLLVSYKCATSVVWNFLSTEVKKHQFKNLDFTNKYTEIEALKLLTVTEFKG